MGDYATAAEVRDDESFGDLTVTDPQIDDVMTEVERRIEEYHDTAWVPRSITDYPLADGSKTLWLSKWQVRSLTSATVDGEAADVADWTVDHLGKVTRPTRFPKGARVEVTFSYGADEPPADLRDAAIRACITLLRQRINPRIGERTDTVVAEGQTINFAGLADSERGRVFGMPDVDAVVRGYGSGRPAIA